MADSTKGASKDVSPSWIKTRWEKGTSARRVIDREIWQSFALLYGEHYAVFDPVANRFRRPDPRDGKVRLTINLTKGLWRTEMSRLMKAKPIPEVISPSDDEGDRNVAKLVGRLLNSELERLEFERFRLDLITWLTAAGHVYAHPNWDYNARGGEGEVALELVTPVELVRDPGVRYSLKEAQWVIHGKVLTSEQASDIYGQEFPPDTSSQSQHFIRMVQGWQSGQTAQPEAGVLVLRAWHKACKKYPNGRVMTIIGDKTVEDFEFPYDHGELPFIDFHHIRLPGRYEGQSTLVDLRGPQKDFNQARSRMAELRSLLTAPGILAPKGSLEVERISGVPGQIWEYNPTGMFRPEPLNLASPPGFLFQEANQAYSEMQDISRQHEVSHGQVPRSGLPAAAVALLQESDDSSLAPTTLGLEEGIGRIGKQVISLVKQYWPEERAVTVYSEDTGSHYVDTFKKSDITDQIDVQVVPGSALPRSKAAQRQDLLSLWDRRVIQDPRLLVRYMELPNSDGMLRDLDVDTRHAQREHDHMLKYQGAQSAPMPLPGQPAPVPPPPPLVESWHNHDVHIAEHNNFRKTEEFEQWDPALKGTMDQHVQQHEEARLQKAQADAQNAAMTQAAGGAAPVPGGAAPNGGLVGQPGPGGMPGLVFAEGQGGPGAANAASNILNEIHGAGS